MRYVENDVTRLSLRLRDIARYECVYVCSVDHAVLMRFLFFSGRKSEGLSGRTLRKLPFLAHTLVAHVSPLLFINASSLPLSGHSIYMPSLLQQTTLSMDQFLHALEEAVAMQFAEREDLAKP